MSNVKIIELLKSVRDGIEVKSIEVNDSVLGMLGKIGVDVEGIKKETTNVTPVTMPTSTLTTETPVNTLNDDMQASNVVPFVKNEEKGHQYTLKNDYKKAA